MDLGGNELEDRDEDEDEDEAPWRAQSRPVQSDTWSEKTSCVVIGFRLSAHSALAGLHHLGGGDGSRKAGRWSGECRCRAHPTPRSSARCLR